ncbi:glycosyltransferase family 2 protein [Pontibacter sp. CAU 1760]
MQTIKPIISVLMTSFNREKYIKEAIDSVLASTFRDFELIIVDDCSTDKTYKIASSIAAKDSRIKVYKNEINLGDYPNRNKAASYATGKYIKYLDSDDTISQKGLEIFVNMMEQFPEAAFALSLDSVYGLDRPIVKTPPEIFFEHFTGKGIINCGPSGSVIRKCVFDNAGGFLEKRYIGDTELWLRLSQENCLLILPSDLISWREHEGQEFKLGSSSNDYIILRYHLAMNYITNKHSPISYFSRIRFSFNQTKILLINNFKVFIADKKKGFQLSKSVFLSK